MNNTDSTYREKGRAVFLAAIMVLSMVALPVALSAPAAAISDGGNGVTTDVSTTNVSATHNFTITVPGTDSIAGNNLTNVTVNYGANFNTDGSELDNVDAANITVLVNGSSVPVNTAPNGVSGVIDVDNTSANAQIGTGTTTIDVEIEGVDNPNDATTNDVVVTVGDDAQNVEAGGAFSLTTTEPEISIDPASGVTTVGSSVEYTVTANDSNGNPINDTDILVDNTNELATSAGQANGALSETITTDTSGEATIELFNTTAASPDNDGIGTLTFDVTQQLSSNPSTDTVSHISADQSTTFIEGEISDDTLPFSKIEDSGNISITITTDGSGPNTIVDSVKLSDFDDLAQNNQFVESANFVEGTGGDVDQYTINLQSSESQTYTFEAEPVGALQGDFAAFDGPTRNIGPGQSDTRNLRLERLITPDDIQVVNVEPSSQVDIDQTVDVTVEVTTDDTNPSGPLADTPVRASVNGTETDSAGSITGYDDIFIGADGADETTNTDSNGQVTFSVSVDGTIQDIQEIVNTQIDFTATEGNNVQTSQDLAFAPDIGDTGTISGDVDVISEDINLGTQSNSEARAGVEVHAVQFSRLADNTVEVSAGEDIEELNRSILTGLDNIEDFDDVSNDANVSISPTFSSVSGNDTGLGTVRIDRGDAIRVVTYDQNGEEAVQDPRSDYLAHSANGVELIQNESDQTVEIHADDSPGVSFNLSFLSPLDDYQVQQKVVISNSSSGESVTTYQNITVIEDPYDAANTQTDTEDVFNAQEDLTYSAIDERYNNESDPKRSIPTDVTNEQGNYELLNLPVNVDASQQYAVIAGGADTGSSSTEYGFANFRGFDIINVSANAQPGQLNTDLSVQEFEPVNNFVYNLDVTVDNGEKSVEVPVDNEVSVEVSATQREVGSSDDPVPAAGIELDLESLNSPVGDLADTTVTTDSNGEATTTFTGDSPTVGVTNISASYDAAGETITTEGGEQAEIEVFQDAQITGDVVDDSLPSNNLPGAEVTLKVENESQSDDYIELASETAGPQGSFSFTGSDGVQSNLNYTVEATFEDEEGNEGTGFALLTKIPGGTTNADIVIEDVVAPEGFDVLELNPADVTVTQGDVIDVTATIENQAGEEDTQDVSFRVTDENGSTVVDVTQEVTLGAGESSNVTFSDIDTSALDAGDYTHGVFPSDGEDLTATLTVEANDDNNDSGLSRFDTDDNGEIGFNEVLAAINAFNNDTQIGGEDVGFTEVIDAIDAFNNDTAV